MKWHQNIWCMFFIFFLISCTARATINAAIPTNAGKEVTAIDYSNKKIWLDYIEYKIDDKALIDSDADYKDISLSLIKKGDKVIVSFFSATLEGKRTIARLTKISNKQDTAKTKKPLYDSYNSWRKEEQKESVKAPPQLLITAINLYEPSNDGILHAEETGEIRLTVRNNGKGPALEVNIVLNNLGDSKYHTGIKFNEKSFIGRIDPGEQKDVEVTIEADKDTKTANIKLQVAAVESNGFDSKPVILSFQTKELIPPLLQIASIDVQDVDGKRIITKGKEIITTLTIQNAGTGMARNIVVSIDIKDDFIKLFSDGKVNIRSLLPGESKKVSFNFGVTRRYSGSKILPVYFIIDEERDRFSVKPDIKLALGEEAPEIRVVKVESREARPVKIEVAEGIETVPVILASQQIFNKNDIAIVIGIERYQNLPKSDFSYNDAKIVRGYLKALGFADRNIEFVTDEKATRSGIEKSIEKWLPNRANKASKVLIYYSGHGSPDPETGEPYIVPNDGDPNYLSSTGYPLKRLYGELEKLRVDEITVILDSCFSGSGGRSVLAKGARPLVISSESLILSLNLAVVTATQGSQISTSSTEKEHGIFTYYFLRAIKDGKKNLAEIYEYIKPLVEDEAKTLNVQQSPSISPDIQKLKGRFSLRN